ncbi:hypothetical protein AB0B01_05505 [Streptomyces sp. NPDC044571]
MGADGWREEKRPVPGPASAALPEDDWIFLDTAGAAHGDNAVDGGNGS